MIDLACRDWLIERRSVTSCDHGSKISRTQQSFLTEMAIFVPECNHAQEQSHTSLFFRFFFAAIFAGPCYHGNIT